MQKLNLFLLIAILIAIGTAVFLINYTKQPLPAIQPIKLPVKAPKESPEGEQVPYGEGKLPSGQEKTSIPEESEKLEEVEMVEIEEIKCEIRTKAEGLIIKYQEEFFYSENDFSIILENEEEFKSQLIERLNESLIGAETENFEIVLDQSKKTAILKCVIIGARYGTNSYDMHFLLGNWPFDLYQFKKYEKKLVYDGEIDGVPTKVVFEFPYALSHCHEHVWPR